MFAIFYKELAHFFKSPLGYVYLGISALISGLLFTIGNLAVMNADLNIFFQLMQISLIFTTPLLTMRLFAEERRHHTDQLLLSAPVALWEIVFAKVKAAGVVFFLSIVAIIPYLITIEIYGSLDWPITLCALGGYILLGCLYITVGTWVSALTTNQMIAAIGTFGALFCLWFSQFLLEGLPKTSSVGLIATYMLIVAFCGFIYHQTHMWRYAISMMLVLNLIYLCVYFFYPDFFKNWISVALEWISFPKRYMRFLMGIIRWGDVAYFLGLMGWMMYLTIWKLEKQRWSSD
ncbi:MAG: ABC transporter permease [Spirochaetia bacterium]